MNKKVSSESVVKDISDARKAGITGTPGFVLGETTENFVQGTFIGGTRPYINFQNVIKDFPETQYCSIASAYLFLDLPRCGPDLL